MIEARIRALREAMRAEGVTWYLIPTADYHGSEYVGEYFKTREYMSGFTGSAGTLLITMTEAFLWTDARYFLQAERELAGSPITLCRMGEEGVLSLEEYLKSKMHAATVIGCDGRTISASFGRKLRQWLRKVGAGAEALKSELDLVDTIWKNRPAMPATKVWQLTDAQTGESSELKFARVRQIMEEQGTGVHVLTCLYDIAWLLNLRAKDITYVPVILSYLVITKERSFWYVNDCRLSEGIRDYLHTLSVLVRPYEAFYKELEQHVQGECVLVDESAINDRTGQCLMHATCIKVENPTILMRAIKNPTQIQNLRKAHIKDAVAMCQFMYWLKSNVGKIPMTELSISDYLGELRRKQEGFIDLSFETISGYQEHGAIVHYSASEDTDMALAPEGLLLVDSGAHYEEGTTDITRTFALGKISKEARNAFTLVLRAHLALANARFLYGCSGMNLDILAREPLWEAGLDYKHGTGHGVGYILNVHEGPNGFRYSRSPGRSEDAILKEGMVTTDEPGLYFAGRFGIRTENELICCKGEKNEYGQFMCFENITYVPIDLDAVDVSGLSKRERTWLNDYHAMVYEVVAPHLKGEELAFLRQATRAI